MSEARLCARHACTGALDLPSSGQGALEESIMTILVTCTVSNGSSFWGVIPFACPTARVFPIRRQQAMVVLPAWTSRHVALFSDLRARGIITDFSCRSYTDWPQGC